MKKIDNYLMFIMFLFLMILSYKLYSIRLELRESNNINRATFDVTEPHFTHDRNYDYLLGKNLFNINNTFSHHGGYTVKLHELLSSKPSLLFFLSSKSCSSCDSLIDFFNQISILTSKRLNVVGVLYDCNYSECSNIESKIIPEVNVIYDSENEILNKLDINLVGNLAPPIIFFDKTGIAAHASTNYQGDLVEKMMYIRSVELLSYQL